jgi:hypothetical protein
MSQLVKNSIIGWANTDYPVINWLKQINMVNLCPRSLSSTPIGERVSVIISEIYGQLDALSTLPLQDNSGKSPDFLELLMGHQLRTGKWVGDSDCVVRDFKDSQTVVQKK